MKKEKHKVKKDLLNFSYDPNNKDKEEKCVLKK